jgi:glutathione S-transferase
MHTLITMRWAPPAFQGQVRDLAVRWTFEELGLPHAVQLVDDDERRTAGYRAKQPFGQVPVLETDGIVLFEMGAIVQHLAERTGLMPTDAAGRARARAWMFAALNSLDPDIISLAEIDHFAADQPWAQARRPALENSVRLRIGELATALGARDYLVGAFSAADIVMIMVLRALRHTALVSDDEILRAYRDRCESRPAFQRALAAQLHTFARHAPRAA